MEEKHNLSACLDLDDVDMNQIIKSKLNGKLYIVKKLLTKICVSLTFSLVFLFYFFFVIFFIGFLCVYTR